MDRLDALLREARGAQTPVPAHVTAAVLDDAQRLQPAVSGWRHNPRTAWIAKMRGAFGGWRAMGGLVAATCAGFWIGISPPAALEDAEALIFGAPPTEYYDSSDGAFGFGWDMDEG